MQIQRKTNLGPAQPRPDSAPGQPRHSARDDAATPRQRRKQKERMLQSPRRAELWYSVQLRKIARIVGGIAGTIHEPVALQAALRAYSVTLRPWATAVAARMLADVNRRDATMWQRLSRDMGAAIQVEVETAPTGARLRELMVENVGLITSLPTEAAQKVHEAAIKGLEGGSRDDVLDVIRELGQVTESRAKLIARTETGRAATSLTQARAEVIGSDGYIWRSAEDADVRKLHRKLNGKFFRWDEPPVSGERGERSHPGAIYNCRCYPEPVIPPELERK
jgi:SPP1 gp7 family putative phage head morphogenesis protein